MTTSRSSQGQVLHAPRGQSSLGDEKAQWPMGPETKNARQYIRGGRFANAGSGGDTRFWTVRV
jgi:hypothetical protein